MKKRLISLLLTVVMLVSLCSVFGTSASAAANVTTVTLASGQNVLGLCQNLGVDFYTYKNLIMDLNGFTSESAFSKLSVGQEIVLPVNAAAAALLAGGTANAVAASAGTATAVTTAAAVTGTAATASADAVGQVSSIPAGDRIAYYLVKYTIQKGETIQGIYANWGLSYKTYDNQIKKLNNIASYNSIAAGQTLLLPTTSPAVANSTYYTVMAHNLKRGDSAYDIINNRYGMNFSANQKMVLALNNTTDLAKVSANTTLYIPVSGVVSTSTSVAPTTSTTTTTATVSAGGIYSLVSQTPVNGSFDMLVNGVSVTTAPAGKTVKVAATPDIGYAVDTIRVVKVGDASTSVGVSDGYFTMPSYSVVVSVTFKAAKAYNVKVDSASNGSVTAMVNGLQVTQAYVGNTVTVKTIPATGFMLDYIRVTYNDYKDSVAVYNNSFVMPDHDVTVSAVFAKDPHYDPSLGHAIYTSVDYGTIKTYLGNSETSHANKGDRIRIEVTPNTNYTLESLAVFYDNFKKTAEIDNGSFTMPDGPVTIVATIKPTSSASFAITKVDTTDGKFGVYAKDTEVHEAKVGTKLTVKGTPKSSAYWYIVTVTKTGDSSTSVPVTMNADGTSTFTMPDFPVSVRARFYLYHKVILDASNGLRGSFGVYAGNIKVAKCASGVELSVKIWGVKNGYAASSVILTYADGSSYTLDGTTFIMPDCDVKVNVVFNEQETIVAHAATVNGGYGKFGNTYTVGGKTMNGNKAATAEIKTGAGKNIVVHTNPALGYEVDQVVIAYTDKYGNPITETVGINPVSGKYQFQMPELKPGTKLNLYVSFRPITTYPIVLDYKSGYIAPDDNLSHKKGTFAVSMLTHTAYVDHAKAGEKAQIHYYPAAGYAVDTANVKVYRSDTGAEVEINKNDYTFVMPAAPVQVVVPFYETSHWIQLLRANDGTDGQPKGVLSVIINGIEYRDQDLISKTEVDRNNNYARTKFPIGTLVTVVNSSRSGYVLNSEQPIIINKVVDGSLVNYKTVDGDHFTFEMPNADVVISAQYIDDMVSINALPAEHGSYKVPLQVAWNGKFSVTEIVPENGYELDKILVSYISHNGDRHDGEVLVGTTLDLSREEGMLLSDINVEVLFKPAINPMSIKYIFDDQPDEHSNYKVDLLVDGKKVEGIVRGEPLDVTDLTTYTDHLLKYEYDDPNYDKTGYGIQTGKTVVIRRNESKVDENFQIVNIWLMHGEVAIKPDFSNGQYYFTMPYVSSGISEELSLFIEYGKFTSDSFALSAYKAGGDGEVSAWQFYVDSDPKNYADIQAGTIDLQIDVPDYCEVLPDDPDTPEIEDAIIIRYTDSDGVAHPTAAELEELKATPITFDSTGSGRLTASFTNNTDGTYPSIQSMPQNKAVTVEYMVFRKAYAAPQEDVDGFCDLGYSVDGQQLETSPDIKWGKAVTMNVTPKYEGEVVDTVKVFRITKADGTWLADEEKEEIPVSKVSGSMYQFDMPKGEIEVVVTMKKVFTTVTFDNSSAPEAHASFEIEGVTYTDSAVVAEGTPVKFTIDIPGNYTFDTESVYDSGSSGTEIDGPDGAGKYSFVMPADNVVIEATIDENLYNMDVIPDVSGLIDVPYTVIGGELTDTEGTGTHSFTEEVHYGDTFTIAPALVSGEIVFKIKSCLVNYRDIYGNEINENASINADGTAVFSINNIPRHNPEDVIKVMPVFVENKKATYSINYAPTVEELYKMTYAVVDSESVAAGVTVKVTMNFKWFLKINEERLREVVTLTYYYNGMPQPVEIGKVQIGQLNGYNQSYPCTFTFKMPAGDVLVEVDTATVETYLDHTVSVKGASLFYDDGSEMKGINKPTMGNTYYVKLSKEKAEGGYSFNVTLSYKDENGVDFSYTQENINVVSDYNGDYYGEFELARDPLNDPGNLDLIPLGAVFSIEVTAIEP